MRLISPETDPEILAIVAMLEAHGIPSFVRGGGMGGLLPGVQINAFNTRDIMVPEEKAAAALELLKDFQTTVPAEEEVTQPRRRGRLRNLIELILFGWFVPRSSAGSDARADGKRP